MRPSRGKGKGEQDFASSREWVRFEINISERGGGREGGEEGEQKKKGNPGNHGRQKKKKQARPTVIRAGKGGEKKKGKNKDA